MPSSISATSTPEDISTDIPTASSCDQKLLPGDTPVKAGHHAHALIRERRHHCPQIAGSHRNIAVADHEKAVCRRALHALQRPDFGIGIRSIAAAQELGPNRRVARRYSAGDFQARILLAAGAKDNLELGIILFKEALQMRFEVGFRPVQRLEQAYRGGKRGCRAAYAGGRPGARRPQPLKGHTPWR